MHEKRVPGREIGNGKKSGAQEEVGGEGGEPGSSMGSSVGAEPPQK